MLGEAREAAKGPQGSPELKPLRRAEPLSSLGHQDFQGHHLPPGSPEAPEWPRGRGSSQQTQQTPRTWHRPGALRGPWELAGDDP